MLTNCYGPIYMEIAPTNVVGHLKAEEAVQLVKKVCSWSFMSHRTVIFKQ
jgi:hypothetical protein